jgi:hypothetical protein
MAWQLFVGCGLSETQLRQNTISQVYYANLIQLDPILCELKLRTGLMGTHSKHILLQFFFQNTHKN